LTIFKVLKCIQILIRYVNYSTNQGLLESPYENCLPLPPNLNVLSPAIL
jgi:hypothetical protein